MDKEDKQIIAAILLPLCYIIIFVFPVAVMFASMIYGTWVFGSKLADMLFKAD